MRRIHFLLLTLAAANLAVPLFLSASPGRQASAAPPTPTSTAAQPAQASNTLVVVLDPAHGGADAGARGAAGAVESEIVLDYARAIRVALEGQGLRTLLTREGNEDPTIDSRSTVANSLHGAVFISLHVSSTGPIGTARTYWYAFPNDALTTTTSTTSSAAPSTIPQRGLVSWDRAQQNFLNSSRRLAELVQIQLAQKFKGSAETPAPAAVLQLRTIAAPAIAIEVSSVAVPSAQQLVEMARPLAEAVTRGLVDFRSQPNASNNGPSGAH